MDPKPDKQTEGAASPLAVLKRFTVLRQQHAKLQVEKEHMLINVKRNILAGFQQKLGTHDHALKRAALQVSRLKRELELVRSSATEGEVDYDRITVALEAEFEPQERQLEDVPRQMQWAAQRLSSMMTFEQSQLFQARYRRLMEMLHPDVCFQRPTAVENLYTRAREAYAAGDAAELEAIELLAEVLPKENLESRPITEIDDRVRRLLLANQTAINELSALRSEWPFPLAAKLPDDTWLQAQRTEYQQKTTALLRERDRLSAELNRLLDAGL